MRHGGGGILRWGTATGRVDDERWGSLEHHPLAAKAAAACYNYLVPPAWELSKQELAMGELAPSNFGIAPAPAEESDHPEDAILFVAVSLVLGVICRQVFKGTRVPYTVALLILGVALGAVEYGTKEGLGALGTSIRRWSQINPELILFVFLPALLFESSFVMEIHQIKRCIMQMVLLAGPGVLISTGCLALVNRYIFPYGWNWSTCLLLGGLLSATDPVAIVALLKELGASKKLSTIVEGESLMNDGTAIVVFQLFFQMVLGQHFTVGQIVVFFSRVAFGAVALGFGFGLVAVLWIGRVFNDTVVEITLTLTASYLAFFVAEDEAQVSGVLTVMTVGMFFAAFARTAFTGESQQSMHHFWEMIAYIANTLIFILSGTVIAEGILASQDQIEAHDWGYLVMLYVFLQLSRAVVVVVLYPGLRYFGYGLNWKEAAILIWAGLRGAVALSLSLSVSKVGANESKGYALISKQTEARFVFFTGGVVLLTLIINGTTTQFLLQLLRMENRTELKVHILNHLRHEMYDKALESFGELGADEDLGPADWTTVREYITSLGEISLGGARTHPHESSMTGETARRVAFQDTRVRFLNGVQAAYWGMLEEGRITRTAAILLMGSVDEALDSVARDLPLQDWRGLKPHVRFPRYLKWRSSSLLPQNLLTYLILGRLELGCYIAAAFLRAHRQAQCQLRDFIGESEFSDAVIKESQSEGRDARDFLEDVRLSFPQVLRVIKTKQVTYAILSRLSAYVTSLEEAGLLEEKETNHLHDIVQVDLKKLHRHPPMVQMPSAVEGLKNHPFFGALPAADQSMLFNNAKEFMLFRDNVLYGEDAKADAVWFIVNGNVKWSGNKYNDRHMLHPIFSHGSTLGLYEALTGKPRLCTMTADSVVHGFYIENDKLMSTLRGEEGLEEFFWQESALVIAKLVIPQHFETVTLQEFRALMIEGSNMRTYIRGEVIEVEYGKIGILLEGFVKQEDKNDVISAPAGLLGQVREVTHRGSWLSSLIPQSLIYLAEARARVLFLDLQSAYSIPSLPSMTSSLPQLGEHGSLLRFPSKYRNFQGRLVNAASRSSLKSSKTREDLSSSYSVKAMERSLFGSELNILERRKSGYGRHNLLGKNSASSVPYPAIARRAVERRFSSAHTLVPAPRTEKTVTDQRKVHSQGDLVPTTRSLQRPKLRVKIQSGDSSGESEEDEHIIEIASPSSLFHTHNSVR
ncbi:unnamed protein product [Calypogeia fissa]